MTEIIITLEEGRDEPVVRIHPWIYELPSDDAQPYPLRVRVLPGISPIRQALLARRALPEQEVVHLEKISLSRIRIGTDSAAPRSNRHPKSTHDQGANDRAPCRSATRGQRRCSRSSWHGIRLRIVANLNSKQCLGFALGAAWPMPVLEVHRIDRTAGTTEPIPVPSGIVAPDIKSSSKSSTHKHGTGKGQRMWTTEQHQRLALEHRLLQQEGFGQFSIYWDQNDATYHGEGVATTNSGGSTLSTS